MTKSHRQYVAILSFYTNTFCQIKHQLMFIKSIFIFKLQFKQVANNYYKQSIIFINPTFTSIKFKMSVQKSPNSIQSLQSRIEQQQFTIQKLKSQQAKLSQYVVEFKSALKRKQQKQHLQTKRTSSQNEQRLQKQLQKQVQNAKTMLKNYQHQLRVLQKKSLKNTYTPDDLILLQEKLKMKEMQLKQVQEQIKDLKLVKRKQERLIEKKENNQQNEGIKLGKLVQQVRKQKQVLQKLREKSIAKEEQLQKKKRDIGQLQGKYAQKCRTTGETPLNFEDFKQKRKQKLKEQMSLSKSRQKEKVQKKIITVKQMINNQYQSISLEPTQKNLLLLKSKKDVAQNSLKLAQRKDEKQIQELRARLQRLRDQGGLLQGKLADKVKQRQQTSKMDKSLVTDKIQPRQSKFLLGTNQPGSRNQPAVNVAGLKLQPITK